MTKLEIPKYEVSGEWRVARSEVVAPKLLAITDVSRLSLEAHERVDVSEIAEAKYSLLGKW